MNTISERGYKAKALFPWFRKVNRMPRKRKVGQVVKINLHNGYFTYGYEINDGGVAILDVMTQTNLPIEEIINLPRLFTVGVLDIGFETWEKVGSVELTESQRRRKDEFIQDPIDLSLQIMDNDGEMRSASFEEVQGLERVVGWHAFNVEQRVRDHFANKTNAIVEFLRPKPPDAPHYRADTPYHTIPGTIKQIDLGNGKYVYARELHNTFYAVYDFLTDNAMPSDGVTNLPVLFTVSVSLHARIGWKSVGFVALQDGEHPLPKRYLRIGSKPTDILIYPDPYDPDFKGRKGTIEEAKGLEPAVMWDNYQVENRIRSYYAGTPWDLEIV